MSSSALSHQTCRFDETAKRTVMPSTQLPLRWKRQSIDYDAINRAALHQSASLVPEWLPDGFRQGHEYVARNPHRADRRHGSFKINLRTGRWQDFATGDRGGDLISLFAFVFRLSQSEAARKLSEILGLSSGSAGR